MKHFVAALAQSILAGDCDEEAIAIRIRHTIGRHPGWVEPLAAKYVETFAGEIRPRYREVKEWLSVHLPARERRTRNVAHWVAGPPTMLPVSAAESWDLPPIETVGALTDWLQLNPGQVEWLADLKGRGYRHYSYRVLTKSSGGLRLIEAPKSGLKHIQRRILLRILDKIPPHPTVHGFVRGRSIKSFVAPHIAQRVVLRMDIEDFFPSFHGARIQAFFRTIGYPESVADLLGGLCTNQAPLLPWPHLPQGAPTSPALANACFWRMDCRLLGLAKSAGAAYTRYADDLAFSGGEEFQRCVERFPTHVAAILLEEGFAVNHRKTRIMRRGVRQHLAGLVVNERPNIKRRDFDLLKAILTNCARHGPGDQSRPHLEGRVGFVESIHPARGQRLRRIFEEISWP